jgi:hypothetical protein
MVRIEDIREAAEAEPGFASAADAIGVTVRDSAAVNLDRQRQIISSG